jgi:hypothetical protein
MKAIFGVLNSSITPLFISRVIITSYVLFFVAILSPFLQFFMGLINVKLVFVKSDIYVTVVSLIFSLFAVSTIIYVI